MNKRDHSYRWSCYPHPCFLDHREYCYCRAANAVLPFSGDRCMNCPLCSGDCAAVSCVYYDFELTSEQLGKPLHMKKYIDGLIAAGLTGVFPDFIQDNDKIMLGLATPEGWDRAVWLVIERAIQFAADAHKGAVRKGTKVPYIVHPLEAAMIVMRMTDDPEIAIAAVLHDVVEDTRYTLEEIKSSFGSRVAGLVSDESENKRSELNAADTWKLRKCEALEHLAHASKASKMVALADKLSNIRSMQRDYHELGDKLWERFNQSDKHEQGWYYRELATALRELSKTQAWQEYARLVEMVFPESAAKK